MTDHNCKEILSNLVNGKSLNVNLVNPPSENPWRTKSDYDQEQKSILRAYRWSVISSLAALITALCSIVLAISAVTEIQNISRSIQTQITVSKSDTSETNTTPYNKKP